MIKHPHGNLKILFINIIYKLLSKLIFLFFNFFFPKLDTKINRVLISRATYAPWIADKKFSKFYKKIKNLTLLDESRLFTLYNHTNQLKYKNAAILDLGCLKGGAGILMSLINKSGKTFLIDTFDGFKDNEKGIHKADIFKYDNLILLKRIVKNMKLKNTYVYKKYFPEKIKEMNLNQIKICHIDVNTYKSTMASYKFVKNKIIKNGIIVFDDYGIHGVEKVTNFVNKISKKDKKIFIFFYNYFGQAVLVRK